MLPVCLYSSYIQLLVDTRASDTPARHTTRMWKSESRETAVAAPTVQSAAASECPADRGAYVTTSWRGPWRREEDWCLGRVQRVRLESACSCPSPRRSLASLLYCRLEADCSEDNRRVTAVDG